MNINAYLSTLLQYTITYVHQYHMPQSMCDNLYKKLNVFIQFYMKVNNSQANVRHARTYRKNKWFLMPTNSLCIKNNFDQSCDTTGTN